jgi:beta-lactam-binding protein with PASTA domain
LLILVVALSGCAGADGPVPDVTGERLDVAKSEMSDAGYDTEEIGGGAFGIIAESNWTVCETDPAPGDTGSGKVKLIVDRECADTGTNAVASSDAAADEPTEEPLSEPTEEPLSEETEAPAQKVRVPDVRGMNHQAAQNRMQDADLFNLHEEDATGQRRLLLYDRNWVVVNQRPRPGARVSTEHTVTLFAKKQGE